MKPKRTQRSRAAQAKPTRVAAAASAPPEIEARVDALAAVLRRHDLNELELEGEGLRIYLRRGAPEVAAALPAAAAATVAATGGTVAPAPSSLPANVHSTDTSDGNTAYVTSPFVGTFYRSPSPDSAPFVDVGTRIRKGQVLCIVEAMKLMNEIESEIEGTLVQILVDNGHAVEYGEPLFKIKQG